MAKTFNAPTYSTPDSEVLNENNDRDQLEKGNVEQERSLAQLEAQNMVANPEAEENPFDKWDEQEHTPEYMMECADYASHQLTASSKSKDLPEKDAYFEHLDELKEYYKDEFGEKGLVDPSQLQDEQKIEYEIIPEAEYDRELTTKEKAQKAWQSLQYAYYGYEIAQGRPEVALQGMFVKCGMEIGNDFIDSEIEQWHEQKAMNAARYDAEKQAEAEAVNAPESKQESLEINVPQVEEHAGAVAAIAEKQDEPAPETQTKESAQPQKSNSAVEALMAKYEADSKAYEERNREDKDNQSALESKQFANKYS